MSLELYQRYEIIFLAKHKYGPELGINRIAKIVNCNRSTVTRWLKRWSETKDLSDRQRIGRSRATTAEQDKVITNIVQQEVDEGLTSEMISHQTNDAGMNLSSRTIRRRLNEAGFKYSKPLQKPLLTQRHRNIRLSWARSLVNYSWNQMIVSDETVFRAHEIRKFFWQRPGKRKVCRTIKYSVKINAWGCLSKSGFGRIVCFKNNLISSFLCNSIYRYAFLPTARRHFGRSQNWYLLEDNDPKHRSKFSIKWKKKQGIQTLPWPSRNPDINPIENLWSLLKVKVAARHPTTTKELIKAIKTEWNGLPQELASNLIASMTRRVLNVIDSNGDYTMY